MQINKLDKRIISLLTSMSILISLCSFAGATNLNASADTTKNLAYVVSDLSKYTNYQIFVQYKNSNTEVLTCSDQDELSNKLKELSAQNDVSIVQPNYTYENTGLSTSDTLSNKQWALNNDGTFQMENGQNDYSVYDQPFEEPSAPGTWSAPSIPASDRNRATRRSIYSSIASVSAVSGMDINYSQAVEEYNGGVRDTVVALIDTGVDLNHEDLSDAFWVNEDEIPNNGIDDDNDGYIDDVNGWNFYDNNNNVEASSEDESHGTHCAGTIAANTNNDIGITGIADSDHIKIMTLKALGGEDGSGTTESIVAAIQYAEDHGATICNLSLGTTYNDQALYQAMKNSSMLFVVAAGNGDERTGIGVNDDTTPTYPASYNLDQIISVANLQYDGTLHYSSNYGATSVDLAAPGTYILSTTPNNTYSYMTGTSMAAPMVTAAAALVYSSYDDITLAQTKNILLNSVTTESSLSGKVLTGGILNIGAALSYNPDDTDSQFINTSNSTDSTSSSSNQSTTSSPVLVMREFNLGRHKYLMVGVTDADNDIKFLRYASGTLTASDFKEGTAGTAFTLNQASYCLFSIQQGGTYTFYARDKDSNETVNTITVTAL